MWQGRDEGHMPDTETVLDLKVRGVPEDIEQRLHGDEQLANEFLEGLEDLCDELDVPYRGFGLSTSEEKIRKPPTHDAEPVEPVEGWSGGEVEHTGGGIFCRIFRETDRHLEVIYGADTPSKGVSLYAQRSDEDYESGVNFGDELDRRFDVETEEDALEASRELMQNANAGDYDEEIDELREVR